MNPNPDPKGLKPPFTPEQARIEGSKGGKTKSEAKTYSAIKKASVRAKCKNCTASCMFKKNNLDINAEIICPIPDARAHAIFYRHPVYCLEVIESLEATTVFKMLQKAEKVSDLKAFSEVLDKHKEYIKPSINKVEYSGEMVFGNLVEEFEKRLKKKKFDNA